ncbi:MAG: hypothetical protein WCJ51_05145 [Candidatus Moraniibacteriota bacterium]
MNKAKPDNFWEQNSTNKNNSKIIIGLLFIILFIGSGSFAYAKFYNKPNTQPKQIPIQISNDETAKNKGTVSQTPSTNVQTQSTPDNSTTSNTTVPTYNQSAEIKPAADTKSIATTPVNDYEAKIAQINQKILDDNKKAEEEYAQEQAADTKSIATTPVNDYEAKIAQINQKILDDNKKAEEEYAQEQAARQARIQFCDNSNKQRSAILDPIKKQINDLWLYYIDIPNAMSQKTKGYKVNQAQLDRMIEAEQNKTQTEINKLQLQSNQLSDQYPVCNY